MSSAPGIDVCILTRLAGHPNLTISTGNAIRYAGFDFVYVPGLEYVCLRFDSSLTIANHNNAPSVFVLGIDGASFDLIQPWIDGGELPNLGRMQQEGSFGRMKSCLPPVTCPAWKCYSTGMNPGRLGVFWWVRVDFENRRIRAHNSLSFRGTELWDYLNAHGLKVGVINMPTTYPPKNLESFIVAGGPDAEETDFAYPWGLTQELKKKGYRINLPGLDFSTTRKEATAKEILKLIRSRFEIARELMERYPVDFMHLTIVEINILHHFLWNDSLVLEAWKLIDEELGGLCKKVNDMIVISDHGCMRIDRIFYMNTWFEKHGYLKRVSHRNAMLMKWVASLAYILRLSRIIAPFLSSSLRKRIPTRDGTRRIESSPTEDVDWTRTIALATGQGPIYINRRLAGPKYESLRRELVEQIEELRDPETNRKICKKVHRREDVFQGPYVDSAPDLIAEQAHGFHIDGGIGKKDVYGLSRVWQAENEESGVFLALGPSFDCGKNLGDIAIYDVAPTILHLIGLPVPPDIDGRVLMEAFRKGSDASLRQVVVGATLEK